ncbi:zinc-dependent peptidase [Oceanicola sp. S124]|uniref:M90 family metallopeptidase n=1 Tax=Oceanicola sp. S124 TaxID=1042378 RepID=UPI00025588E2|nr:M90 family metallopeptidase [Oceanicola sp. S124]
MIPFLLVVLLLVAAFASWSFARQKAREARRSAGLSEEERAIVAAEVPLSRALPEHLRAGYEARITDFLDQVDFVGCDGLEVTEEMRLSIAAQACLLVANSGAWYDTLRSVLVYPGAFRSRLKDHNGYVVTEHTSVRTGESWSRGPVVLSWEDTQRGADLPHDGHNVVFHEFAHQLDDLSGSTDGMPELAPGQDPDAWRHVFDEAYGQHLYRVENHRQTLFDPYGAEGPQEFFAVAVEAFFETPHRIRDHAPEVYAQLSRFFALDPAEWSPPR